jgi:hypothetical protein
MPSKARNIADLLDSNGDVQADALDTQPQLGRRNLIINGAMQVWQRGTSGTTGYVADRFSATNVTSQTKTACDLVGFGSSITIVSPVADTSLIQQVENTDGKFAGQTLTFSFWAKTTTELPFDSDQYCEYYDESDAYQVLSVSVPSVIETNGDWKRYQRTFTLPSTAKGHMFGVRLDFRESVALTIEITGVQLELGSVATPFEHRSYGEELALCQRYYQVHGGFSGARQGRIIAAGTSTLAIVGVNYMTEMRAVPSHTVYGGNNTTGNVGVNYNGGNVTVAANALIGSLSSNKKSTSFNISTGTNKDTYFIDLGAGGNQMTLVLDAEL